MEVSFVKFGLLLLCIISMTYAQDEPEAEDIPGESGVIQKEFPGTSWCIGRKGDDEKPGAFAGLDACCKAHSLCPEKIHPEQEKYGVQNVIGYTMRDCKCDDAFKKCMVDVLINGEDKEEKAASVSIFTYFFRILNMPCVKVPANANNKGETDINPLASEKEQAKKEKTSAEKTRRQGRSRKESIWGLLARCANGYRPSCDYLKQAFGLD